MSQVSSSINIAANLLGFDKARGAAVNIEQLKESILDLSAGLGKTSNTFNGFFSALKQLAGFTVAGLGFIEIKKAADETIKVFEDFQKQSVILKQSLENLGNTTNFDKLTDLAKRFTSTAAFGLSDNLFALSKIIEISGKTNVDFLERALKTAENLAVFYNGDLRRAVNNLGRIFTNRLGELGKDFPELRNLRDTIGVVAFRSGAAFDFLDARLGGLNQAFAQTNEGMRRIAENKLNIALINLGEVFSNTLTPLVIQFTNLLVELLETIDKADLENLQTSLGVIVSTFTSLLDVLIKFSPALKGIVVTLALLKGFQFTTSGGLANFLAFNFSPAERRIDKLRETLAQLDQQIKATDRSALVNDLLTRGRALTDEEQQLLGEITKPGKGTSLQIIQSAEFKGFQKNRTKLSAELATLEATTLSRRDRIKNLFSSIETGIKSGVKDISDNVNSAFTVRAASIASIELTQERIKSLKLELDNASKAFDTISNRITVTGNRFQALTKFTLAGQTFLPGQFVSAAAAAKNEALLAGQVTKINNLSAALNQLGRLQFRLESTKPGLLSFFGETGQVLQNNKVANANLELIRNNINQIEQSLLNATKAVEKFSDRVKLNDITGRFQATKSFTGSGGAGVTAGQFISQVEADKQIALLARTQKKVQDIELELTNLKNSALTTEASIVAFGDLPIINAFKRLGTSIGEIIASLRRFTIVSVAIIGGIAAISLAVNTLNRHFDDFRNGLDLITGGKFSDLQRFIQIDLKLPDLKTAFNELTDQVIERVAGGIRIIRFQILDFLVELQSKSGIKIFNFTDEEVKLHNLRKELDDLVKNPPKPIIDNTLGLKDQLEEAKKALADLKLQRDQAVGVPGSLANKFASLFGSETSFDAPIKELEDKVTHITDLISQGLITDPNQSLDKAIEEHLKKINDLQDKIKEITSHREENDIFKFDPNEIHDQIIEIEKLRDELRRLQAEKEHDAKKPRVVDFSSIASEIKEQEELNRTLRDGTAAEIQRFTVTRDETILRKKLAEGFLSLPDFIQQSLNNKSFAISFDVKNLDEQIQNLFNEIHALSLNEHNQIIEDISKNPNAVRILEFMKDINKLELERQKLLAGVSVLEREITSVEFEHEDILRRITRLITSTNLTFKLNFDSSENVQQINASLDKLKELVRERAKEAFKNFQLNPSQETADSAINALAGSANLNEQLTNIPTNRFGNVDNKAVLDQTLKQISAAKQRVIEQRDQTLLQLASTGDPNQIEATRIKFNATLEQLNNDAQKVRDEFIKTDIGGQIGASIREGLVQGLADVFEQVIVKSQNLGQALQKLAADILTTIAKLLLMDAVRRALTAGANAIGGGGGLIGAIAIGLGASAAEGGIIDAPVSSGIIPGQFPGFDDKVIRVHSGEGFIPANKLNDPGARSVFELLRTGFGPSLAKLINIQPMKSPRLVFNTAAEGGITTDLSGSNSQPTTVLSRALIGDEEINKLVSSPAFFKSLQRLHREKRRDLLGIK